MKKFATLINDQHRLSKRITYLTFWTASFWVGIPCFARAPPTPDARPPLASIALGASGAWESASSKGTTEGTVASALVVGAHQTHDLHSHRYH